ncbi:MAG: tetratricopeptide repeat-containing diguanylate cyclase [Betaproteobacteria bacterium]
MHLPRACKLHNGALMLLAALAALCFSSLAAAALTARDLDSESLENKVADDPRAALRESDAMAVEAKARGDKALQLRSLRLSVMATSQLEEPVKMGKLAAEGLLLARELQDPQAECEFLSAKAAALSSEGKHLDAQPVFDEAIQVAEKAGLVRAATGVMVAKAFVYGLLGRDTDSLDLLFKAHQRYVEIGDTRSARGAMSAIGNAYTYDRASREDLMKALSYHQQSIAPDAESTSRHELATIYFNMGVVYQRLKDFPKAKLYVQKSMTLFRALNDPVSEAYGSYRLGVLSGETGKWTEALEHLERAMPVLIKAGDATMIFNVYRARASAFANLDRRKESLDALSKADIIRSRIDSSWMEVTYLNGAAEVFARLGDYEKAFRNQQKLREAEQRTVSEAREKDSAEAQTRFEVKQKEAENALLRASERESEARRVALLLALALLLFVLGGLGLFLYRQSQQNRRFSDLAMRDELTGLPNRRSILEFARTQLRVSRMDNTRMCLALIDIDHFKPINDNCGHAVGDAVLAAFADVCSHQMRTNDRLGRYGGEEFLLIMPGSDLTQIPHVFARLRSAIQHVNVPGLTPDKNLTFSLGAVSVSGPADDLDNLMKRADDALYRAKQGGRDRYETG